MPYIGVVALGYALILALAALSGLSVLKPKLNKILRVISWLATAALVIYIFVGGGIHATTFTCACLAVIENIGVDFMIGAVIIGKDDEKDILSYYSGASFAIIAIATIAIILGFIISGVMSLAEAVVPIIEQSI